MTDDELKKVITRQRTRITKAETKYLKEVYTEQLGRYLHEQHRRAFLKKRKATK